MRKLTILLVAMFAVIVAATAVSAVVDVTYNFNQNNVEAEAYNCLDEYCSDVASFSGSFPNGQATASGQLTISYPTALASEYGYAIFFFSPGFVPKAYKATWYGTGATSLNRAFNKINDCRATIDTFDVVNDAQANIPLVINVSSSLSALTWSPFHEAENYVSYVPPARMQEYYSADTTVTLNIYDSLNNIVDSQLQDFSAANGNSIYMEDVAATSFSWTPAITGKYRAEVVSNVVDSQCASTTPMSSAKQFNVLNDVPKNSCYVILNGLEADAFPVINQEFNFWFTMIANKADGSSNLQPVPATVLFKIFDANGNQVYSATDLIAAASDAVNPQSIYYTWTGSETGDYTAEVTATPATLLCSGIPTYSDVISTKVYVQPEGTYAVTFSVVDSMTGLPIPNAVIIMNDEQTTTNLAGVATISGLKEGFYYYEINHPNYLSLADMVYVNSNLDISLAMQPGAGIELYQAIFTVTEDGTQNYAPIVGATVDLGGEVEQTDINGQHTFIALAPGTYGYTVSKEGYTTVSGTFTITNSGILVGVQLSRIPEYWAEEEPEYGIHISAIRIPAAYEYNAGDTVEITLSFANNGDEELEDVKASVTVYDLALRESVGPFDLKKGKKVTKTMYLELPEDAEKQSYYARITIDSNEVKRVVYREFEVIEATNK
jgi:hypothetical protein